MDLKLLSSICSADQPFWFQLSLMCALDYKDIKNSMLVQPWTFRRTDELFTIICKVLISDCF